MKSSEDLNLFIFQLTLTKLSHVGKRLGKKNTMTGTKLIFLKLLCIYYYRSCKFHHPSILNSEYFLFGQKIQHSIQFLRDYSEAGYQKIDTNKFLNVSRNFRLVNFRFGNINILEVEPKNPEELSLNNGEMVIP